MNEKKNGKERKVEKGREKENYEIFTFYFDFVDDFILHKGC